MRRMLVLLAMMVAGVLLASGVALAAVVSEVEPNQPLAQAQALAAASFDLTANTDIADSTTVPHATVNGSGDATLDGSDNDTFDYYSFTVPAGDPVRVILDIDHTSIVTPPPGAFQFDSWIELYNSSGTLLAASDDDSGDPGSSSGQDSRIEAILDPGTYYVAVGRVDMSTPFFDMGEVPDTATYELHVSLGFDTTPPIDTEAPKVISTFPRNGGEVRPAANIRATFSEEMRSASVINAFKLFRKGSTNRIAATVTYDADTDTATLDPTNNLKRGATYKAVVTTVAKDMAGNRLDQDGSRAGLQQKVWFFEIDD
jgi:hypothetical protein